MNTVLSEKMFVLPAAVLVLFAAGLAGIPYAFVLSISLGLIKIGVDSWQNIAHGHWSLDYIAFAAMIVSLLSGEYIAGAVIALMFTGGEALEAFASERAEASLRTLVERIPKTCLVQENGRSAEVPIQEVKSGSVILLKSRELVPLDGMLRSESATLDVANLTGESMPVELQRGTFVKSGSVNLGGSLELAVVGDFSTSTYHKIVGLVEEARRNPSHFVRIAEQVNLPFTIAVFVLAIGAYVFSGDISRGLAVLVIATPCPLIIAAPVAFIGGLSRAAHRSIIIRAPASLEVISRVTTIFFDKTGTLTLGEPVLREISISQSNVFPSENDALAAAAAIEIHSLHPLARAMVAETRRRGLRFETASHVEEKIGEGISGEVGGARYMLKRAVHGAASGIQLVLVHDDREVARFRFEDVLKDNVGELFNAIRQRGIKVAMITGDRKENTESLFSSYGITIHAEASPEDKYRIVKEARGKGEIVMMVGDGLNDAPALALADIGVVFSGAENAASIEAARVVVLESSLARILDLLAISDKSVRIAKESVYGGIGLSLIGMLIAAAGLIVPVEGAIAQEAIDVVVILNALRSLRGR